MHILVVTQYFYPEEFRINDLVAGLKARGYEITVLTGLPNYPKGKIYPGYGYTTIGSRLENDVSIVRVPMIPRFSGGHLHLVFNYLSFMLTASITGLFLARKKFDAIFVFEPSPLTVGVPAVLVSKLVRKPIFFWVQDLWPESLEATKAIKSKFIINLITSLAKWIYKNTKFILIQSKSFEEPILKLGVDEKKIRYFPNWAENIFADKSVTDDIDEESFVNIENYPFSIMFAGNLGAAQSLETLVSSAKLLKEHQDIHWIILGDGRYSKWLESEIKGNQLENQVHMLGRKPLSQMPQYFEKADLLLVMLRNDPTFAMTIPSKIQSYFAASKPVIAAINGESARIIEESGAGLVVASEDYKELANKILQLRAMSKQDLKEIGCNGRRYFEENFDRDMLINRLDNWFISLLGS